VTLKLAFFTDGAPFEGDALERTALGGSETAFIQMSRALVRQGCRVLAFNNCREPAEHGGVEFRPVRKSLPLLARERFDVMVVSRFFGLFNLPIKSGLKALWNHDTLDNAQALRAIHDEIDLCLVLSRFHLNNFLTRLPQLEDRTVITKNGLDLELLDRAAAGTVKRPGKLIYASRPERGLKLLLEEIWPRLAKARGDLRLHLCGYQNDSAQAEPGLRALYDYLDLSAARDERIVRLGCLPKTEYYRHLAEAEMMVYPSIFPEVSCLAVLEAQALGTAVTSTDAWALSESVTLPEFRVSGRPGSPEYVDRYVERTVRLLNDPAGLAVLAGRAKEIVRRDWTWDKVATDWLRLFKLGLRAKQSRSCLVETAWPKPNSLMI
jgi:glycosyltransferase involved in cell wall biosynthesis